MVGSVFCGRAYGASFWIESGPEAGTTIEANANGDVGSAASGEPAGAVLPNTMYVGSVVGKHVEAPVIPVTADPALHDVAQAVAREQEVLRALRDDPLSTGMLLNLGISGSYLRDALKDADVNVPAAKLLEQARKDDAIARAAIKRRRNGEETKAAAAAIVRTYVKRGLAAKARAFTIVARRTVPQPSEQLRLVDLGPGAGVGVSSNGLVTGYSGTPAQHEAFLADGATRFTLLPPANGVGVVILPKGTVGGQAGGEAGIWPPSGEFTPLPGLGGVVGGDDLIRAYRTGIWYGASDDPTGTELPTEWTPAGVPMIVPGLERRGSVFDVNARGDVVGTFFQPGGTFLAGELRGGLFLLEPSPVGGDFSAGYTVNDFGIEGGSAWYPGDRISTGELWLGKRTMSLTNPPQDSYVDSLNALGWGVGGVGTPTSHRGALFAYGRVYDVHRLLTGGPTLTVTNVNDINARGQMAGTAVDANGAAHAVC